MSSPKIICKTAYTKNIEHVFNLLEYAGNAIASQAVIFKDGSVQTVSADKKIYFSEAEISMVDKINIGFKDGGSKNISYETYRKIVEKTQTVVTVDDLVPVTGNFSPAELDFMNITGEKPYRELIDMDIFKYLNYFSQREGVVKSVGGHGLFGVTGDISITDAKELAAKHIESRKWLHILSLPEGEDVRTGFDKREMWQALISAEAPRIAKLYNISLENLVINAGLHTNTENTHNHLVLYSKDPKEGYIKGDTKAMIRVSERFKSIFVNKIFKDDISSLNTSKALVRDELKTSLDQHLKNIKQNPSFSKEISDKFLELADVIKNDPDLKENSSYGYMKSKDKVLVDDLLHTMIMSDPDMKNLFEKYMEIETEYIKNYNSDSDKIAKRLENLEGCFFAPNSNKNKSYHNVIYRAVQEFNKLEMPPQFVRTVEREISDFSPIDDTLSSLLGSEPPPDTFSSFSSEYLEANLVRTVEGKISDFKLDYSNLSSENTKQCQVNTSPIENTGHKEYYSKYKEPLIKNLTYNITECLCDEKESFSSQLILQKLKSIRDFDKPESAAEIIKYIYNTDLSFKEEFGTEKAQELIEDYKNSFFSSDSDIKNPLHQTVKYLAKVQFERTYQKIIKEHRELFEPMGVLIKYSLLNALKPHNSSMKINSLLDELGIKIEELDKLRKIEKPDETIKEVIKENLKLQTKLRSQILKQFDINTIDKAINECTPTFDELFQKYCDPNDALAMSERLKSDIYAGEANISSNYTMQFYAENANSIRQNGINYRNALVVKSVGQIMKLIATSLHTHANYLHQENERKNKLESALRSKKQFKTKKFDRGGFATDKENQISY